MPWTAFACVALLAVLITAGGSWPIVIVQLLVDGFLLVAWLVACFGIGRLVLRRWFPHSTALISISSIALGMGIISLLMLLLGLAGRDQPRHRHRNHRCGGRACDLAAPRDQSIDRADQIAAHIVAARGVGALPGHRAVRRLVPPGLLWGDEPNGYDVVEYHLQVPRKWYEAGRHRASSPQCVFVFSFQR